jgi:REP element-mobilizing transposase RayT
MARQARGEVFDPLEVSTWHCINRCVRRCFLCGDDPVSGKNFDHRKQWLEARFRWLAANFGMDVLDFAILSNHFHLILRNRPDVVATWSAEEVARRWLCLCPLRKNEAGEPEEPTDEEIRSITGVSARLTEIRCRLSDISWFMRMVAEPVARRANFEDETNGRFWQGRFRSVKLCDEAALLACSVYVDLNPIRAGLAETPESSDFTSAQRRIEAQRQADASPSVGSRPVGTRPDDWLAPLPLEERSAVPRPAASDSRHRCSDKGFLPMSVAEYLELLDWTGRQLVAGKRGSIPAQLSPILSRLGIEAPSWLELASNFGRLYHRVAGGCSAVHRERTRHTARPFRCGHARLLGSG